MSRDLPLTQVELDQVKCECCERADTVHRVFLHSRCHPAAGTRVSYDKMSRSLVIECRECRKFICKVLVATTLVG